MANGISANYLGKLYDWGSLTLEILGDLQVGCNRIDIKHSRASDNIYGFGQQPIGYINKNFMYSATVGLLYDQVQQLTLAALALGYTLMEIPPFPITMALGFLQDPLVPQKLLTVQNCRFTSDDFTAKQNDGGFYNEYQIACAGIITTF